MHSSACDWVKCWSKTYKEYYFFNTTDGSKSWKPKDPDLADIFIKNVIPLLQNLEEHQELHQELIRRQSRPASVLAASLLEEVILRKLSTGVKPIHVESLCRFIDLSLIYLPSLPKGNEKLSFVRRIRVLCDACPDNQLLPPVKRKLKSVLELLQNDPMSRTTVMPGNLIKFPDITAKSHTVIVLLGPPEVGKSTLGKHLLNNSKIDMFVDIGKRLRDRKEIERYNTVPTKSRFQIMFLEAKNLLWESLDAYMRTDGALPMMVTFVKVCLTKVLQSLFIIITIHHHR